MYIYLNSNIIFLNIYIAGESNDTIAHEDTVAVALCFLTTLVLGCEFLVAGTSVPGRQRWTSLGVPGNTVWVTLPGCINDTSPFAVIYYIPYA